MIVFICLGLVGLTLFIFSTMLSGHDHTDPGHDIDDPDTVHDSGQSLFSVFAFSFFLTGFGGAGAVLKA